MAYGKYVLNALKQIMIDPFDVCESDKTVNNGKGGGGGGNGGGTGVPPTVGPEPVFAEIK